MYCKAQLVQLQRDEDKLRQAGFGLAAISYDSTPVLQAFSQRRNIRFPLLSDHDSHVIRAFGVVNSQYRNGAKLDIEREVSTYALGDVPVYGLSRPAVFVVGPDRRIAWRFVSQEAELRLTGTAILRRSVGVYLPETTEARGGARVSVKATSTNSALGLGNRVDLGIEVKLPKGFHAYSPKVAEPYRGVTWEMDTSSCWETGAPEFPEPLLRRFPFSTEKLSVYEGTVQFRRELMIKPMLRAGDATVFQAFRKFCLAPGGSLAATGSLKVQICDERQCFPPEAIPVEWKFDFIEPDLVRSPVDIRREFEP